MLIPVDGRLSTLSRRPDFSGADGQRIKLTGRAASSATAANNRERRSLNHLVRAHQHRLRDGDADCLRSF
jgi:hypothetical protein